MPPFLPYLSVLFMLLPVLAAPAAEPVRFGRDVLPILSAKCFSCHGPDEHERKGGLRLDREDAAKARAKHDIAVVPGKPGESALLARVLATDPDEVMPPPESNKTVTPAEAAVLRRWIEAGAPWGRHWSFEPVVRPPLPVAGGHPVDAFVLDRLRREGLEPTPAADPRVLLRRLSLDLIGLPPTPTEADAFAADPSPAAYAKAVDALLASPRFGEHWARMWLDIARHADTKGYEKDRGRTVWPYRDWVIDAFNRDLPLDRFTEEQLAGDLLPDGAMVATVFHRNTMANDEGGTDDEEFRTTAVKDRVDTTVQAWMGLTMGCAKCHTHKYDPISIEEYYSFYALFNQTEDADRGDDAPVMAVSSPLRDAERVRLEQAVQEADRRLSDAEGASLRAADGDWRLARVTSATGQGGTVLTPSADGSVLASGKRPDRDVYVAQTVFPSGRITALRLETLPAALPNGRLTVGRSGKDPNFVVSEITVELPTGATSTVVRLNQPRADYEQEGWPVTAAIDGKKDTGWAVSPHKEIPHAAVFALADPLNVATGTTARITLVQHYGQGLNVARFRFSVSDRDPATVSLLPEDPSTQGVRKELSAARQALAKFEEATPRVPVMKELEGNRKRVTRLHRRGSFLDPGEEVRPGLPSAFGTWPAGAPTNRLGVARWLVSHDNPLTPRVWANRVWARLFGLGLVETEEDLGALGTPPSHPELLDWLAAEYRDGGWSLKKLLRVLVTSETYRRDSRATAAQRAADPRNRLLARGARQRLTAEAVRDQALAVSGLLSDKTGGPPVMPPQPAGLWRSTYSGDKWVDAEGPDRWRRGIYTFLKRTSPHPFMTTFDAGSREVCLIRRIQTNTPLQALLTLNDPAFLEAASALARRMVEGASGDEARARLGLRLALIREVDPAEAAPLLALVRDARTRLAADPASALDLLAVGRQSAPAGLTDAEFAAWTVAANAILNLDEVLSRP